MGRLEALLAGSTNRTVALNTVNDTEGEGPKDHTKGKGARVMGQALTEREIEAVVREVTDEEIAFYHEYGWVMMKGLVDRDFATELLSVGQA